MSLISSSDCSILFVQPTKQHLSQLDAHDRDRLPRRMQLVNAAAATAGAPCHVLTDCQDTSSVDWLAAPGTSQEQCIHRIADVGPSWPNSGLAASLGAHNRSILIVSGFWLETSVSFIALSALWGGFDVFVLLDTTPSLVKDTRGPSCDRLVQAGVVPSTTHQLIAEWIEQSSDAGLRTRLSDLHGLSANVP
jgi:hypothetical protein